MDNLNYNLHDHLSELGIIKKSYRFKGGGGGDAPTSDIAYSETGKKVQNQIYPMVEQGLKMEGFANPELQGLIDDSNKQGLLDSYTQAKGEMNSQLNRSVKSTDSRVTDYANNSMDRAYTSTVDDQRRSDRYQKFGDMQLAQQMGTQYVANEQRMSMNNSQAYNSQLQANMAADARGGTFGSNLAGGIGGGMMDYYFAQQMGKK